MLEIKEKIQRQKDNMEEILAKADAASKAEKGKQKEEMVEIKEKIRVRIEYRV